MCCLLVRLAWCAVLALNQLGVLNENTARYGILGRHHKPQT
jgi:hypothetical protein